MVATFVGATEITSSSVPATVPPVQPPAVANPTKQFASLLEARAMKHWSCALDIMHPFRNSKGNYVSRTDMQGEIFRILASLPKGRIVTLWGMDETTGKRFSRIVRKHMSTRVPSGKAYGEVSFSFTMPDGNVVVGELPVHRIVAIECVVDGRAKEYVY